MIRFLLAITGVLMLGSIAAFLLFVPLLSIVAVVSILLALLLMFGIGVQVGNRGSHTSVSKSVEHQMT
jgi:hypothetical protein